jgi:CheY-like chemotaxis protein
MSDPTNPLAGRQKLRVVLVEDSSADAERVLAELQRSGFDVTWHRVETEAEYLERLEDSPEIVLADYALPQFSGPRALELLQEQ